MTTPEPSTLRYVALGDSYTIGTSVDPIACWPAQLVELLARAIGSTSVLRLVANLGVNGYMSGDLIRDELPQLAGLHPGFGSLQIGVNDVVRGVGPPTYDANVRVILRALLARLPADRIITVSIPDYTVTPRGAAFGDPRQQSAAIDGCNAIMAARSAELGIRHVDVLDLSRRAGADRSLVAGDGLHPSAGQYRLWLERIAPVVTELLAARPEEVSDPRA